MSQLTKRTRECIRLTWITWLLGPLSFAVVSATCWLDPGSCNDPPNVCFACALCGSHVVAAVLALVVLLTPGPHRRRLEARALYVYAACIAGWLAVGLLRQTGLAVVWWGCLVGANVTTTVVLVAGVRRYLAPIRPPGRNAPR